ncbi:MAG: hypothetical protein PX481_03850, partial [Microcystis sp. M53603_WE2]|uniref:hypothetical protein n=1 Tax=Microcystis sp. M53603_WE2 TaxID=3030678 RepID=UPI00258E2C3F
QKSPNVFLYKGFIPYKPPPLHNTNRRTNSISLKKYEAIKIIFIRVDSLTRKTFGLEIILGRGLLLTS